MLLLLLTQGAPQTARASARVALAVVVARGSDVPNLSLPELRRIFTSQPVSDGSGRRFVPFNFPPHSPERVGFDRILLGFSAEEVSQFWVDRKIRGQPGPPRSPDSVALLLKLVQRLPGAIAYVRVAQLPKGVQVVRVNGKLPSDPGYPLMFDE